MSGKNVFNNVHLIELKEKELRGVNKTVLRSTGK